MEKGLEKLKVVISPDDDGVVREVSIDDLRLAAWSSDPGTGKAVMLPDKNGNPGYEVHSPLVFAPPIGYEATPPIEQLIADRVKAEYDRLKGDDEVDDILDAEDFDVPDEEIPLDTIYEVIAMKPEVPQLKKQKDRETELTEKAKADLEYEELKERERHNRRRAREASLRRQQEEAEMFDRPPRRTFEPDPPQPDTPSK